MDKDKFKKACETSGLELKINYDDWRISISGKDKRMIERAQAVLNRDLALQATVIVSMAATDSYLMELLTEQAAIRGADGLPYDLNSSAVANLTGRYKILS